ncbi:MAG: Hsp20/alpha crystallin family protein [Armatimonadetes bacterium]|nr:Hsp20/alpha crystallin family protein [Armatimonadota bacterium]
MSLIRWYRTRNLPTVWDQMEQMAREMSRLIPWQEEGEDRPFGIPVNVYETDKEVVVKAELPGVKKEDLDVNIQDNTLTIRAQTREESEVKEESYYRRELRTGSFFRAVPLPVEVKEEELKASYENGVLTVTAPKAVEKKVGRKVEIK